MPSLAVVLLNYNGLIWLQRFLPAVIEHSPKDSVYVIDNASTDQSLSYLRQQLPAVRIITLSRNLGYTGGYNKGLRSIRAPYYALLNTDIFIQAGWWQPLLAFMEAHPEVGACQPKIRAYTEKNNPHPAFDYAGAAGGFLDILGYPYCRGRIFTHIEPDHGKYDTLLRCDWASGACCLLRAQAFWEVGGFDARFFMHMEEIDLCWRLHQIGYSVYCCPQATVAHVGGGSLPRSSSKKLFYNFKNSLLLLYKHLSWKQRCWVLPLRGLLDGGALLYFWQQGRWASGLAIIQAYMAFLRQMLWKTCPPKPLPSSAPRAPLPFPKHRFSILYAYFVKKHRSYSQLKLQKK